MTDAFYGLKIVRGWMIHHDAGQLGVKFSILFRHCAGGK
tara:strand:- start:192 stop:308 length:117 start_codon:yes stop_codon:yes gene_type:complete